jgi:AraC-like DNA-binding protein
MNITLSIFSTLCLLLCLLASFILFFINKVQLFSNRLLAIVLFILALANLNIILFYSGLLIKMPFLYRIFIPISLLLLPFSYFYVRSILNPAKGFQKLDWLVLIPSILSIVNFWPVYTLPTEQKLILVTNLLNNIKLQSHFDDGYLPPYIFSLLRTSWSGIFIYLQFDLIRKFQKNVATEIIKINKDLLQWLLLFSKLFMWLLFISVIFNLAAPILKVGTSITDIALQLLVFIITLKLFMQPQILYGIYIPSEKMNTVAINPKLNEISAYEISDQNSEFKEVIHRNIEYKEKIDMYFKEHQPFLNPDYSLSQLVDAIQIPQHLLSSFINQEYGMGFRKFINEKRVAYIIENSKKPEWKNLTLEAISLESGFGNRSTFIKNFKAVTGKNPLQYFKNK